MHTSDAPSGPSPGSAPAIQTFSPEEVAAQLGTSAWWVREQVRKGRVAHLRLGKGRIRFSPVHIASLVELVSVEPQAAADHDTAAIQDVMVLGATVRSLGSHRTITGRTT